MRETFEATNCQNLDTAYYIYEHPDAEWYERSLAKGYIDTFWTSHAALATGGTILTAKAVAASGAIQAINQGSTYHYVQGQVYGGHLISQVPWAASAGAALWMGADLSDNLAMTHAAFTGDQDAVSEMWLSSMIDGNIPIADAIVGAKYFSSQAIMGCSALFYRVGGDLQSKLPDIHRWLTDFTIKDLPASTHAGDYLEETTLIRTTRDQNGQTVGWRHNVAIMDYYIDGQLVSGDYAVSGQAVRPGAIGYPANGGHYQTDAPWDTERYLLEELRSRFIDNPGATGRVVIYTDAAPCQFCESVRNQFLAEFGGRIQVQFVHQFPSTDAMQRWFKGER